MVVVVADSSLAVERTAAGSRAFVRLAVARFVEFLVLQHLPTSPFSLVQRRLRVLYYRYESAARCREQSAQQRR